MIMEQKQFLGRDIFDATTNTWRFKDGSGVVPGEMRLAMKMELDGGPFEVIRALGVRWSWGERLKRLNAGGTTTQHQ